MKTDVIFLGAGASRSAGFPTNRDLANYIIDDISHRGEQYCPPDGLPHRRVGLDNFVTEGWPELRESFRLAGFLSVDKYCEHARDNAKRVMDMKCLLRMALFDFSDNWIQNNDYRAFAESLFSKEDPSKLDPRFTVVNFNYDGLLGKLLTDMIVERYKLRGLGVPSPKLLAAAAGGYYCGEASGWAVVESDEVRPNEFAHHMPHGTFLAVESAEGAVIDMADSIYSSKPIEWRVRQFAKTYKYVPLIHFPWETDRRRPIHSKQYEHVMQSVAEAARIHFIGLSGDPLLRHSLKDMFKTFPGSDRHYHNRQWHVVTPEGQWQTFVNLTNCFWGDNFSRLTTKNEFLARERGKQVPSLHYKSFKDWIHDAPHLQSAG